MSGRLDYGRADKTPYSLAEAQSLLSSPVTAVNSVTTSLYNGSTTNVTFYTNRGPINMSGLLSGYIANGSWAYENKQTSYAYFNVEKMISCPLTILCYS